jgi:hypothetical protein
MLGSVALLAVSLTAGCAAPARTTAGVTPGAGSAPGPADSATVVLDVSLHRSAELADSRGALRVFDQDLRVEYRRGGRGPGLDAGPVTLDGKPLGRVVSGKGAVSYRMGREGAEGETREDPWMSLANEGGPGLPATIARVKLAPFPVVTQPIPGQSVIRTEDLTVVMLPPVAGVWYRVSLRGAGEQVMAVDMGQGRWVFPHASLEPLSQGGARILIEVETSCGDCEVAAHLRANWSSRGELEVPITLL